MAATLRTGESAELEIAVLVYDLPAETIAVLLEQGLRRSLDPLGCRWSKQV